MNGNIYILGVASWHGSILHKGHRLLVLPAHFEHIKWAAAATHMSCCWAAGGVS